MIKYWKVDKNSYFIQTRDRDIANRFKALKYTSVAVGHNCDLWVFRISQLQLNRLLKDSEVLLEKLV